jgi:hypothetical protein
VGCLGSFGHLDMTLSLLTGDGKCIIPYLVSCIMVGLCDDQPVNENPGHDYCNVLNSYTIYTKVCGHPFKFVDLG